MLRIAKFVLWVGVSALFGFAVHAQDPVVKSVPRYDDADEYLPQAVKRNREGARLFLRQIPEEVTLTATSDRNVSIKIIARIPDDAKIGVILLVGGTSVLSIGPDDKLDRSFNYTSRSRDFWWSQGIATFLVDAPSDHLDKDGVSPKFRATADFSTDMRAVIKLIAGKFDKPLHAIGHSNGAIAIAAVASLNEPAISSYVLVSPAYMALGGGEKITQVKYGKPVLIVEHRQDTCTASPASSVDRLAKSISAPEVNVVWLEGGMVPISGPCGPFSYHSFFGTEQLAVEATARRLR
jgi:hypothetical protein